MDKNTGFYGEIKPFARQIDGMLMPVYRDAGVFFDNDGMRTERQMTINGQTFFVTSIFPAAGATTPTEKILTLIDLDLKKNA